MNVERRETTAAITFAGGECGHIVALDNDDGMSLWGSGRGDYETR